MALLVCLRHTRFLEHAWDLRDRTLLQGSIARENLSLNVQKEPVEAAP